MAGDILRRGAYATYFAGHMPHIHVLAADKNQNRTVWIQVKTKHGGKAWQISINHGQEREALQSPTRFWILVDLAVSHPAFYIIPEWWIQNDIFDAHQKYLDKHGGKRARNPQSAHHAITLARVHQWRDYWDLLEIFQPTSQQPISK